MMNVKRKTYLATMLWICLGIFSGCKKNDNTDTNLALYNQIDGTYILKSAVADQSVDVNMDGISSNDMISEISLLNRSQVDINVTKTSSTYRVIWPEQSQSNANSPQGPIYGYSISGPFNFFNYDKTSGVITPKLTEADTKSNVPVEVLENGVLKLKIVRTLFTATGQRDLTINAVYSKDTKNHVAYH